MKYLLFVFICIFSIQISTSGNIVTIQNLNEKYSLAKKRVNCMYQDSKGFVWFGMVNGLYKFDQQSFSFISSRKNKNSRFPEADVRAIIEIKPGLLLVGTFDKGLLLYDSKYERSYEITGDSDTDFSRLNVKCLWMDKAGIIWVGTYSGYYRIKIAGKEGNTFKIHQIYDVDLKNLVSKDFVAFDEPEPGIIWFATMNDIGYYNSKTKEIRVRPLYYIAVSAFVFINPKKVLIGCFGTGVKMLDIETFNLEPVNIKGISEKSLVRSIYKDKSSNIWVNISNEGLLLLESGLESANVTTISNKNILYSNLNSNVVYQINESRDGAIWICGEDGISAITLKKDYFKSYNCNIYNQKSDFQVGIRSVLDSRNGFLWVGTIGGGLKQMDLKTNKFLDVPLVSEGKNIGNSIQALMQDRRGNLWLGTEGEGIVIFYPDKTSGYRKGKVINYRIFPQAFPKKSIPNDFVMCILEDRNKNIWIGTWGGLSLIESSEFEKNDPSAIVIQNFTNNPHDNSSISNNTIMSLLEDDKGNIWVGTQGGLNKVIKTGKGYKFEHNYKSKSGQSILEKKILCTFQSKNGKFWFSNQDGGLSLFDPESGIFEEVNTDHPFFDNIINSIIDDARGNLWLGSNNGLCRLDQNSRSVSIYTTDDGLISNDFLFASNCKIGNNLCFGLNNGLTIFSPQEIIQEHFKPNLVFTDFRIFNKRVTLNDKNSPLKEQLSAGGSVVLKHNQNFITISFSALDFKLQKNIQYQCLMEGLETTWDFLNQEHRATYTNLPPGNYTFRVKAYSSNDNNNISEIALKIIVKPPFWKTFWAYALYLLIIIVALFQTYSFFIKREKQRNALALERLNAKRTHEMDLMRLQFFTNISHEFRTPLTLISAPLNSLIKENPEPVKAQSYYQIMLRNVQRLTRLIDQLLDLRKIEEGYLKMDWTQGDIIAFIRKTFDSFQNYAQKRNMNFTFQSHSSELLTYFDPDKLDKILFNIFSNAFKYTEDLGSISIELKEKSSGEIPHEGLLGEYIEIKVSDSGIGISKDDIQKLFKPFQQIDSNKPIGSGSTGIGLSLTKELVELHNGVIKVDSEIGKGSVFTIYLPIYKANPLGKTQAEEKVLQNEQQSEKEIEFADSNNDGNKRAQQLVLIVEDNPDLRTYLRSELQKNYYVDEASNGEEGLERAIQRIPDLVISDVMMPGMDGMELCRTLKLDERTSHIPVILLTARHSEDVKLTGYEMEADDYITKPFNMSLLLLRIRNLIEQRRKLRAIFGKEGNNISQENGFNKIDSKFLEKLNAVIEQNIDNPDLDPVSLAKDMLMSKMQLYRKVAAITNQTVFNYIRTVRLNKAAHLLATTDMQISEIALAVGYDEPSNFTKNFTRQFNQNPSQYIKSKRK
jgi:signal transduction histidine kinase/DNA-binding response OmpR family regulator/ligand-binding sensor domain-containing protein